MFEKTIWIDAPTDSVFETIEDPESWDAMVSSIVEVSGVSEHPSGGRAFDFTYKLLGMRIDGSLEPTEYDPDERIVYDVFGGMDGEFAFEIESDGDESEVTFTASYEFDESAIDSIDESAAEEYNRRQFENTMESLRSIVESRIQATH